VGSDGLFDGFTEYTDADTGSEEQLNGIGAFGVNNAIAVGEYGDIVYTTDAGSTWSKTSDIEDHMYGVSMASTTVAVAVGIGGNVIKTTNSGATWISLVASGTDPFGAFTEFKIHAVSFVPTSAVAFDVDEVYLCASDGLSESAVFYSSDISASSVVWTRDVVFEDTSMYSIAMYDDIYGLTGTARGQSGMFLRTIDPTGTPTGQPSGCQVPQPSRSPTTQPSAQPSGQPTSVPSVSLRDSLHRGL
jgi:hypothetical protein